MSVKFRKGRKPAKEARRILRLETEKALRHLDLFEQDPATHVHQTRRAFRRIRSLLRLTRAVNPYAYNVENRFFGELGRSLSAARDQDAALEIAEYLQHNPSPGSRGESAFLLRRQIREASRIKSPVDAVELQHSVRSATEKLLAAQRRYAHLSFASLTRKKLRKAVERTMRQVRQSYRIASAGEVDADLHRLRKHVRNLANQMTMCAPFEPSYASRLQEMKQLAGKLGTHHDLCVVQALLPAPRDALHIDDLLLEMRGLIETKKHDLRQVALEQARGIISDTGEENPRVAADRPTLRSA